MGRAISIFAWLEMAPKGQACSRLSINTVWNRALASKAMLMICMHSIQAWMSI